MGKRWCHIRATEEQKQQLRDGCKKEFLEHHPDFSGMELSDSFILQKIMDWYMEIDDRPIPKKLRVKR